MVTRHDGPNRVAAVKCMAEDAGDELVPPAIHGRPAIGGGGGDVDHHRLVLVAVDLVEASSSSVGLNVADGLDVERVAPNGEGLGGDPLAGGLPAVGLGEPGFDFLNSKCLKKSILMQGD